MAQSQKIDRGFAMRLDEFEQRMFVLKVNYEKYFMGIEKKEPVRERELLQKMLGELLQEPVKSAAQRHRVQMLRARMGSNEYYITRQVHMLEKGTHPRQRFRAEIKAKEANERLEWAERRAKRENREAPKVGADAEMSKSVYDQYIKTRRECGQSTDVPFDAVKKALDAQIEQIKATHRDVVDVRFRIAVKDGKAKVQAIPIRKAGPGGSPDSAAG